MSVPTPFFFVTGDATKTPVDPFAQPVGTNLTLAALSTRHPDQVITTTLTAPWPPPAITSFVYVAGDANKTPVDLASQPQGTDLVFVSNGHETPVVAGTFRMRTQMDAAGFIKMLREREYSSSNGAKPSDPTSF